MNLSTNFTVNKSFEKVVKGTKVYFETQNFQLIRENKEHLQYKKGSRLKNMIAMNPINWKSQITIYFEDKGVQTIIKAVSEIDTFGQMVVDTEKELWHKFLENYKTFIIEDKNTLHENSQLTKEIKKSSWKYLWELMRKSVRI